jgi:hypothetical protein
MRATATGVAAWQRPLAERYVRAHPVVLLAPQTAPEKKDTPTIASVLSMQIALRR